MKSERKEVKKEVKQMNHDVNHDEAVDFNAYAALQRQKIVAD